MDEVEEKHRVFCVIEKVYMIPIRLKGKFNKTLKKACNDIQVGLLGSGYDDRTECEYGKDENFKMNK